MKKIIKMEIVFEGNKYWITSYLKNGYKEWHGFRYIQDLNKFIKKQSKYLIDEMKEDER